MGLAQGFNSSKPLEALQEGEKTGETTQRESQGGTDAPREQTHDS